MFLLFSMTFIFLKITCQVFCRTSFSRICLIFFSWLTWVMGILWKTRMWNAIFMTSFVWYRLSTWHITADTELDFLTEVIFQDSTLQSYSVERYHCMYVAPIYEVKSYVPFPWEQSCWLNFLGILLHGRLSFLSYFIHLFNYLVMSVWVHGHIFYVVSYSPIYCTFIV